MSTEFHTSGQKPSSPPMLRRHGSRSRFRTWAVVTGAAAVATAGLLAPAAAGAAQASTVQHYPGAAAASVQPYLASATRAGGQQLPQSTKITEITMTIKNNTHQILNLVDAEHSGTDVHWEKQAPATIAVGGSATVSAYSNIRDTTVDVTYQGAYDDALYKLHGVASVDADGNAASGSSDSSSYTVASSIGGGFYPDATYNIEPGGTFDYTGQTTEYTVPVGITQLSLEAIGGGTLADGSHDGTGGADVTGTLAVTPGEKLLIGVASSGNWGEGHGGPSKTAAGWGMTYDGSNYSGGSVNINAGQVPGKAGGGATVVVDEDSGTVIAVAGGGGGNGVDMGEADCPVEYKGGNGGEGGSWTGGNGNPWPGGGGQAGANTSTEGQSSTDTGLCVAGAGGGGVKGGLAGTAASPYGGGAGSSAAPGLTSASIKTDEQEPDKGTWQNGQVILSAVPSQQASR